MSLIRPGCSFLSVCRVPILEMVFVPRKGLSYYATSNGIEKSEIVLCERVLEVVEGHLQHLEG